MKKIVFIQQTGLIGGSGLSLLNTVNMLKDEYNIVVYCPKNPMDLTNILKANNIEVKNYDFQIGSFNYYNGGPMLISRSFFLAAKNIFLNRKYWIEEFEKESPDYLMVNSMILSWMVGLVNNPKVKSICFIRETLPPGLNIVRTTILKKYLNRFSGVTFLSKYDKERFNLKKTRTVIIRDCLDKNFIIKDSEVTNRWPWNFKKEKLNLLFVGGEDPIKGLHIALEALIRIKDLSCQLLVAGYMKQENKYQSKFLFFVNWWRNRYHKKIINLLKNPYISQKVRIIGIQKDMRDAFSSCDLLIFPSTIAHQSRPSFEIGAYSKPVIISDFKQTKEYIVNGKNGLVFKANSSLDLAKKIEIFYNNRNEIIKMGKENYFMTKEIRSYEKVKTELHLFLKSLL